MPARPRLPHWQHCALRRAERVAEAVARIERALDRSQGRLDLAKLRRSRSRRPPFVEGLRIVEAKLAEAGRW